jgi:hypothetical protein
MRCRMNRHRHNRAQLYINTLSVFNKHRFVSTARSINCMYAVLQWWQGALLFNATWLQQAQEIGYTAHVFRAWHFLRQTQTAFPKPVTFFDKYESTAVRTARCVVVICSNVFSQVTHRIWSLAYAAQQIRLINVITFIIVQDERYQPA